jgi:hypothetical protein
MKRKKILQISYSNAEYFKLNNKRVNVFSFDGGDLGMEFKILSDDTSQRAYHKVEKNIVTTVMRLSTEAALCLMLGLQKQLAKEGIIEMELNK